MVLRASESKEFLPGLCGAAAEVAVETGHDMEMEAA